MNFDNLSPKAQTKALKQVKRFFEDRWSDFYADDVLQDFSQELEKMGYEDIEFFYRLAYSQGDGACFTATINQVKFLAYHKQTNNFRSLWLACKEGWIGNTRVIKVDHMYNHYNTIEIDREYTTRYSDKADEQLEKFEQWAIDITRDLCKKLYRLLCESYEWIWCDENLLQYAKSFEYNKKGKMIFST